MGLHYGSSRGRWLPATAVLGSGMVRWTPPWSGSPCPPWTRTARPCPNRHQGLGLQSPSRAASQPAPPPEPGLPGEVPDAVFHVRFELVTVALSPMAALSFEPPSTSKPGL